MDFIVEQEGFGHERVHPVEFRTLTKPDIAFSKQFTQDVHENFSEIEHEPQMLEGLFGLDKGSEYITEQIESLKNTFRDKTDDIDLMSDNPSKPIQEPIPTYMVTDDRAYLSGLMPQLLEEIDAPKFVIVQFSSSSDHSEGTEQKITIVDKDKNIVISMKRSQKPKILVGSSRISTPKEQLIKMALVGTSEDRKTNMSDSQAASKGSVEYSVRTVKNKTGDPFLDFKNVHNRLIDGKDSPLMRLVAKAWRPEDHNGIPAPDITVGDMSWWSK